MGFELETTLREKYQCNDLRFGVGRTCVWSDIMKRQLVEGSFSPEDGEVVCATKCLGFFQTGKFIVAVVRQHWFGYRDAEAPHEIFHLEPVFHTTTGQYICDTDGVCTRRGITVSFTFSESRGIVFELGHVFPEYQDVPWNDLVDDIKPYLMQDLTETPWMF